MSPAEDDTPERVLDEYLVVLSQAGAVEALDRLARRWTPRLLRYAARMLGGSTDAARDVVQDTWIGALRGLRGLRDPAQFPAWIYGITTRRCADAIRASTRRRLALQAAQSNGAAAPRPTAPEARLDLASAIRGLPPEHRAVLHLFYGEELSVDEVASALAIPVGTVKSRLHYAREALKRHFVSSSQMRSQP